MSSICVAIVIDGVRIWTVMGYPRVSPFEICTASPEIRQKVLDWSQQNLRFCKLVDELDCYLSGNRDLPPEDLALLIEHVPGTSWEDTLPRLKELQDYRPETKRRTQSPKKRPQYPGFIYLLKTDEGLHKVGKTKYLDNRLTSFGLTLPFSVELITSYHVPDMHATEVYWHRLFASKQVNGEWFRLDNQDVQAFIATAQEQAA